MGKSNISGVSGLKKPFIQLFPNEHNQERGELIPEGSPAVISMIIMMTH